MAMTDHPRIAWLLACCIVGSACSTSPPPAPPKALTDDEFIQKLSAEHQEYQTTVSAPAPLWADYDAAGAQHACQQFILDRLKAPASAKFPPARDAAVTDLAGGKFRILAYVDSENSFSALIRNTYDCSVHWVSGTNWSLDNLDLKSR